MRASGDLQLISVDNLKARVRVGVPDLERAEPQDVLVGVTLALDNPPDFIARDRIGETVDYDSIIAFVRKDLDAPAHLIETLAERVARHCLSLSPRAAWVEVWVKKPSVLREDGMASVCLRRTRQ